MASTLTWPLQLDPTTVTLLGPDALHWSMDENLRPNAVNGTV